MPTRPLRRTAPATLPAQAPVSELKSDEDNLAALLSATATAVAVDPVAVSTPVAAAAPVKRRALSLYAAYSAARLIDMDAHVIVHSALAAFPAERRAKAIQKAQSEGETDRDFWTLLSEVISTLPEGFVSPGSPRRTSARGSGIYAIWRPSKSSTKPMVALPVSVLNGEVGGSVRVVFDEESDPPRIIVTLIPSTDKAGSK